MKITVNCDSSLCLEAENSAESYQLEAVQSQLTDKKILSTIVMDIPKWLIIHSLENNFNAD